MDQFTMKRSLIYSTSFLCKHISICKALYAIVEIYVRLKGTSVAMIIIILLNTASQFYTGLAHLLCMIVPVW